MYDSFYLYYAYIELSPNKRNKYAYTICQPHDARNIYILDPEEKLCESITTKLERGITTILK